LFNQQQCFIDSTASFLSKLRTKKVEKLVIKQLQQMTAYRKFRNRIPEPGTTISGFADNNNKKNKKINADRPTLDFFDM
jgi:hypothetical protein